MPGSRSLHWLPTTVAAVTILTAIPFAWSRDFGFFVIATFFYLPALAVVWAGLWIAALFVKRPGFRRATLYGFATVLLALPALLFISKYEHDRISFMLWYPFHRDVIEGFSHKDGVVAWDSWGMAGMNNDAYLVSVSSGTVTDTESASRWVRVHHLTCPVADVQRVARSLYIFTTANCPLL